MKTYMVKQASIIIIYFYVFSVFILCLFSFLYFCLFKKRNKYVALDFSADFLIFNFYFVSSVLLI
jgi:predicted membrane channel-forming protein YqfA (hemolysin III family)